MSKIFIVSKREFLSRVQKKTFLLTTILLPIIIFGFYGLIIYFSVKSSDNFTIAVTDKAKILGTNLENKDELVFEYQPDLGEAELKKQLNDKKFQAYIYVPENFSIQTNDSVKLVSGKTVGLLTREKIQRKINAAIEEVKLLNSLNITKTQLDSLQKGNKVVFSTVNGSADNEVKAGISFGVGYISGFLIYIVLFIYGTMVMRGVMEEKTNRIAEVIVSSVKPFQLMMGKIIGIGAVGLLQFVIWILLVVGLNLLLPILFPDLAAEMVNQPIQPAGAQAIEVAKSSGALNGLLAGMKDVHFSTIAFCFLFYFLGGYLLYSSLFAAVGSAVNEDPQDAQSLLLPITMPIIFAIVIMTKAVNDPTSGIAVFGSLFPLTSPIVMMARIPFGVPDTVPYWQLFTSMFLLITGFLGTTWLSGKIYRVGILMYGKKVTWKEMWKWAFRKN
ncbi:MAG: ABC transporter permease [Chitinophagaceae bacterium]